MRGGAIPIAIWAFLLALLMGNCWFWSHDGIDTAVLGFAVSMIVAWALALVVRRPREALRRGAPSEVDEPEALPTASMGAVMLAWGAVSTVFGFEFGQFLIYFGIGLTVVAIAVLLREHYHERGLLRDWQRGKQE
jgi:hypothetical protein